jgi:hypothetical protein
MSMLNNPNKANSSLKKIDHKILITKSKTNNLLLTDFNKFSLFNCNLKANKKKLLVNNKTYSNNSFKIQKNTNTIVSQKSNICALNKHINSKFKKSSDRLTKINKKISINNHIPKSKKILDIFEINNVSKHNRSLKCNSVNNLIGINISVNYMNKNYSINKIKPNSYMSNDNNYNIYNNNSKCFKNYNEINKNNDFVNNNLYNTKYVNESFNEVSKTNNIPYSTSGKNKINKKNIFRITRIRNNFEKMKENLKIRKLSNSKIDRKEFNNISKNQNILDNKKTINSSEDNNISYNTNKTYIDDKNMEKSSSCRYIHIPVKKIKTTKNIFNILLNDMNRNINKYLKQKVDIDKLYEIIIEYYVKYTNEIEEQHQKKFAMEIFYHLSQLINEKQNQLLNIRKQNEDLVHKNKIYKKDNENLMEQYNLLIQKNNILENKVKELSSKLKNTSTENIKINEDNSVNINKDETIVSHKSSSSVNSEELESIRFFDKIIMKKHSFMNIPELSFQKIHINNNKKFDKLPKKKTGIKQRYSFQGNNSNLGNKQKKYSYIKGIKKDNNGSYLKNLKKE